LVALFSYVLTALKGKVKPKTTGDRWPSRRRQNREFNREAPAGDLPDFVASNTLHLIIDPGELIIGSLSRNATFSPGSAIDENWHSGMGTREVYRWHMDSSNDRPSWHS
jgi:hypothetical protein